MKTLFALAALLTAPSAFAQQARAASNWEKIAGTRSAISGPVTTTVVARTPDEWKALWARHTGGTGEDAPAVDFSRDMVVGVFLGQRPRAGYAVQCTMVVLPPEDAVDPTFARRSPTLVVYYKEVPPTTQFGATAVTAPFELRKVSKWPAVSFEPESLFKAQGRIDQMLVFKDEPRFDR